MSPSFMPPPCYLPVGLNGWNTGPIFVWRCHCRQWLPLKFRLCLRVKGWEHSQMSKYKRRLTQRKHPAAEHCRCTVILVATNKAGGEGRQNWATPTAVTQGGKNTSLRSENREWVWWAGLPALSSSPNALKKQQDKKCFLGHSWLKIQEENILVCPQKARKACSCLGHKNCSIQSWNLVVTGSVVEKQWKRINLLDFPPPAGRRAAHSRELNTISAPHRDCAVD